MLFSKKSESLVRDKKDDVGRKIEPIFLRDSGEAFPIRYLDKNAYLLFKRWTMM